MRSISIDPRKFREQGVFDHNTTLFDIVNLERLMPQPILTSSKMWRYPKPLSLPEDVDQEKVVIDPDIPNRMYSDLVQSNANWTIIPAEGTRARVVTFSIPEWVAKRHGFEYDKDWTVGSSRWVLTDDGFVVPVIRTTDRDLSLGGRSRCRVVSSWFGNGYKYRGYSYFCTDVSAKRLFMEMPPAFDTELRRVFRHLSPSIERVREEAFATTFVHTGNVPLAQTVAEGHKLAKVRENYLESARVVQMIEERTRTAMQQVLARMAIEGDPEQYVVQTLIDMNRLVLDGIRDDPNRLNSKLLDCVRENVDKLSGLLAMKPEQHMITTERRLELPAGSQSIIASEIEKRKADKGLGEEIEAEMVDASEEG